jgi:hypothetical protein
MHGDTIWKKDLEVRRHYTYHSEGTAAHPDRPTNDTAVSAETPAPDPVAQDDCRQSASALFFRYEETAQCWFAAEE